MEKKSNTKPKTFNVGNIFSHFKLGGDDFTIITKITPHFINYVRLNSGFGLGDSEESYTVTHGRAKKRMLGNKNYNSEYCKIFDITAKSAMSKIDIEKLKFIPMSNHEISLLTTDELKVIDKIGLSIVTTD